MEQVLETTNPYKSLRVHYSLTQKELAQYSDVTPQVIVNVEAGLFSKPPIKVSTELVRLMLLNKDTVINPHPLSGYTDPVLDNEGYYLSNLDIRDSAAYRQLLLKYYTWVRAERHRNSKYFVLSPLNRIVIDQSWLAFRESIDPSHRGFCRKLVLQQSILQDYEKYSRHRDVIYTSLMDVGLDTYTVQHLMSLPKKKRLKNVTYKSDRRVGKHVKEED